jgi:hypothetical protein
MAIFGEEQVAMRRFSGSPYSECVEVRILEKSARIDRDSLQRYMSISNASSISDHDHMGAIVGFDLLKLAMPKGRDDCKGEFFASFDATSEGS